MYFGSQSRYKNYSNQKHSYFNNHNNISAEGDHTQHLKKLVQNADTFPPSFAELLQHETRNLQAFKLKLNNQKKRIDEDLGIYKNQMFNVLDDLRLSLHAHLDKIYQIYLNKYSEFKDQLQEVTLFKNKVEIQSHGLLQKRLQTQYRVDGKNGFSKDNNSTISRMEHGNRDLRKNHITNYISEIQREKIPSLYVHEKKLIALNQYNEDFYLSSEFCGILSNMKERFHRDINQIYQKGIPLFIKEVQAVIGKEQIRILDGLGQRTFQNSRAQFNNNNTSFPLPSNIKDRSLGSPLYGQVSPSLQALRLDWVENINIIQQKKVSAQGTVPLCSISINNQLIFGCRDGSIVVKSIDGLNIATVKNHKSSVCFLALIKVKGQSFLVSGSDYGCSSIIIWETTTWKLVDRYDDHIAAVSSIIDLEDGYHLLSTGYDKRINIYNLDRGKLEFTFGSNSSPIIGAVMNKSGTKLSTATLDKSLTIWSISRNSGVVESISLQRRIQLQSLTCSINSSSLLSQVVVVGSKDGKIRLIDIEKGQIYHTMKCSNGYIVETVLIQRESKPKFPILIIWQFKESTLKIINTQNGINHSQAWPGYIQFCCGVGPKAFFLGKGGSLGILSHKNQNPELTLCRIQESN